MYSSWLDLLQSHFFPAYYIPTLEEEARASTSFSIHSNYVFNRGIFKDVLGSTLIYPDYQYRCNQVFFSPQFSFSRWLPSLLPPSCSPSLIQPKFYKRSFKISMVQINLAWRPCLRTTWPTALDTSTRTILAMLLSIMDRIIIMYLKWFFFADFSLGSRVGLACGSSAPSLDVFPSRGWEIDLFFSSSLVTSILILIWCYWSVVHRQSRSVSSKLHYIQHLVFSSRIDSKGWYFFLFSFFEPHPRRVLSGLLPVSMLVYCYYFGRLLYYFSTSLNCSWVLLTTIIV